MIIFAANSYNFFFFCLEKFVLTLLSAESENVPINYYNTNREIVLEILTERLYRKTFGKVLEIFTVESVQILKQYHTE